MGFWISLKSFKTTCRVRVFLALTGNAFQMVQRVQRIDPPRCSLFRNSKQDLSEWIFIILQFIWFLPCELRLLVTATDIYILKNT